MHNYCINKLIDLKEVNVKKIIHSDSNVKIYIETKASPQVCPYCGQTTKHVHDYRN
jgi:transposase